MKSTLVVLFIVACLSDLSAQLDFTAASFRQLNSPYDEQNPVLSPDGKTLYFTIRNHPRNMDGVRDPGDIWISSWEGNQWSTPVHGGTVFNDRAYNAVAGFSTDGQLMYLLSHYDPSGPARTQGISVSRKTGSGWSRPENISIPYFQNKSSIQSGHVTPDGRVFVYSAETYGTHGVDDIYVTVRTDDGKWSEPRNLGPTINTQFQEVSPSLSSDRTTLYYSSNGLKGVGSFDIYASTRLDESYTNWSEPLHLGVMVNSEGRELFFRVFERHGVSLYTSTTNSDGYGDIKFIGGQRIILSDTSQVIQDIPAEAVVAAAPEGKQEEPDSQSIRIYGTVMNARNGDAIPSRITFEGVSVKQAADATMSGYSIVVPKNLNYSLLVEAPGFVSSLEKVDLAGLEMRELEMNFQLQPIEVGTTVNLKSVLFIQSKPELLPESYPELDLVVTFMKANPNVEIELAGHTDNRGSYRQLMSLSQKRVNRVKDYMVAHGINQKRITGKGYGGSKPVAANDTEEGRMLNRRVEFIIRKS